tara:strand:+ start:36 stop:371 length:336 start_codon:yes stop_codon:yes gene_type:complete
MAFKTDKAVSARAIVTPLAETFRKGTTTFKQVKRLGRVIIYELTSKPTKERPDPMVQFEVMITYVDKNGVEMAPGSSMWGTRGWTFSTLQGAFIKWTEMTKPEFGFGIASS